jgi:hypothetical protein
MINTEWRQLIEDIDELDKQLINTTNTLEYESLLLQIEHLETKLQQVTVV